MKDVFTYSCKPLHRLKKQMQIPRSMFFMYYFKNDCEGFIRFPTVRKTFYYFRAFGNLMKPEARVFEITSPTKKISNNYHFNEFLQFKYFI